VTQHNRQRALDALESATENRETYQRSLDANAEARARDEPAPAVDAHAWATSEFELRAAAVFAALAIDDTLELVSVQLLDTPRQEVRECPQSPPLPRWLSRLASRLGRPR
jgi:hypothetical protein